MLGTSAYINEDIQGVREMHEMLYENLDILHPLDNSPECNAIDNILPMSDSIFLTSEDVNNLTKQWCRFLVSFIISTSDRSTHSPNEEDPRTVDIILVRVDNSTLIKQKQYPLFMRSGISIGNFEILETKGMINREPLVHHNIIGEGVVKSVRLIELDKSLVSKELTRKGVFFLTNGETYTLFDDDLKSKCICHNDIVEIMWPLFYFTDRDRGDYTHLEQLFKDYQREILNPTFDLLKYYVSKKDERLIQQYKSIMRLLGKSFLLYYDCKFNKNRNACQNSKTAITGILEDYSEIDDLNFDQYPNEEYPSGGSHRLSAFLAGLAAGALLAGAAAACIASLL
jgi:hypothetical protein